MNSENELRSITAFPIDTPEPNRSEARQFVALGTRQGWDFRVLGRAPMPSAPIHLEEWLLVPAQLDNSDVPARTIDRISKVYAAGLRPKGFVIIHEAPKILQSPSMTSSEPARIPEFVQHSGNAARLVGQVAGAVARLAATVGVALPVALVTLALLIDPILVAVTEEDDWIEIDRWWT